jgi:hypothetical protein
MSITNEILEDFESIDKRVFILSLLIDDYIIIFKEKVSYAERYSFLRRAKDSIRCYMIYEFYKLLSPKENGSYPKFINKIINNFKRIAWKTRIDLKRLKDFRDEFKKSVFGKTYSQIINIRDRICGHYDKKIEKDVPTYKEFETFMNLVKELHFNLNYTLFNSHRDFGISDTQKANLVIDWLENYDNLRNLILTEEVNKKEFISIRELKKYI